MAKKIGTLGEYDQRRLWKLICIINAFDILFKKKNLTFHWIVRIENGGKYHYEINIFFSNTHWTQLLAPLEILMSKISLKYIPIHIHNFKHSRVIMNMKLSRHDL